MGGSEQEPPTLAEVLTQASLGEARRIALGLRRTEYHPWQKYWPQCHRDSAGRARGTDSLFSRGSPPGCGHDGRRFAG